MGSSESMKQSGRTEPDLPAEPSASEPGDEYLSSGSFSPITMELDDDIASENEEPGDGAPRAREAAPDDAPQVLAQFGEDPGIVCGEEPE